MGERQTGAAARGLGNFLSGMETPASVPPACLETPALETSLVEWKHVYLEEVGQGEEALETSLVEWKHQAPSIAVAQPGALETSLVEWKHIYSVFELGKETALETSLVEWKPALFSGLLLGGKLLGNFLSGMETVFRIRDSLYLPHPWKLP